MEKLILALLVTNIYACSAPELESTGIPLSSDAEQEVSVTKRSAPRLDKNVDEAQSNELTSPDDNSSNTERQALIITSRPSRSLQITANFSAAETLVPSNESKLFSYENGNNKKPAWSIKKNEVLQTADQSTSIFELGEISGDRYKITATITNEGGDDDWAGIYFGGKNKNNFYLLKMRSNTGDIARCNKKAMKGISLQALNSQGKDLDKCDLWETVGPNASAFIGANTEVNVMARNKTHNVVIIRNGNNFNVKVDNIAEYKFQIRTEMDGGKFGFFNMSAPNTRYAAKLSLPVEKVDYSYQVSTNASSENQVLYSLEEGPSSMIIDEISGLLVWDKNDIETGDHKIMLQASDSQGYSVTQEYVLSVTN